MEINKEVIRQNTRKNKAFTQITLDEDCIVRDFKPDVMKIIHSKGYVVIEEAKISGQTVWVTGKLNFTVFYRSEDDNGKLESLQDSLTFGERIQMEHLEEGDVVKAFGSCEDLSVSAINSRKLAVRALIGIEVKAGCQREEVFIQELVSEEPLEQRFENRETLTLVMEKKDILRLHSEIQLPNAHPNIVKILYTHAELRNREFALVGDRAEVKGEICLYLLYSSEDGQQVWYETMVPVEGSVEVGEMPPQAVYWMDMQSIGLEVDTTTDFDGEMRVLGVDMTFDVEVTVWKEEEQSVLADAYALTRKLLPQYEEARVWKLLVKNTAKVRLSEQVSLEQGQEKMLQLCSQEGEVHVDTVIPQENGLLVEGVLTVHLLYATAEDKMPVGHTRATIPFSQVIDVPCLPADAKDIHYELMADLEQLQVNLLEREKYEVKASISLRVIVLQEDTFSKLVDLTEELYSEEELQKEPGIVGYVAQGEEMLWNLAKEYRTTEQKLMERNGLKSTQLKKGDKILIVRS